MHVSKQARRISTALLLVFTYMAAGCSSGPNIRSDYDHGADFGSYKTYNFVSGAGPSSDNYQSFFDVVVWCVV